MTPPDTVRAGRIDALSLAMGLFFVLAWSSAFTSARIVVADAPPFLALSVRFLISGSLAVALAFAWSQSLPRGRRAWVSLALFGVCQNTLYLGLNFAAMQRMGASNAVLIASMLPMTVAACRILIFRERLPLLAAAGLGLGVAGLALVAAGRLGGGLDLFAVALSLAGLAALTAATLLVRGASNEGNVLMIVGLQMLVGAVTLLPLSLFFETWEVRWSVPLALAFTYTTLVPGLFATLVWFLLVRRVGETAAASFHFLNPCFGVAIAAIILSEPVTRADIIGVAIIMAGILAIQRARRRTTPSDEARLRPSDPR